MGKRNQVEPYGEFSGPSAFEIVVWCAILLESRWMKPPWMILFEWYSMWMISYEWYHKMFFKSSLNDPLWAIPCGAAIHHTDTSLMALQTELTEKWRGIRFSFTYSPRVWIASDLKLKRREFNSRITRWRLSGSSDWFMKRTLIPKFDSKLPISSLSNKLLVNFRIL